MAVLRHNTLDDPPPIRWDWDRGLAETGLGPCFPSGISTGDVDAEVERNGHFLVLEGKRTGTTMPTGQRIAMDRRIATGRVCLIVYGTPPTDIREVQVWPHRDRYACSWRDLHRLFAAWSFWADAQPCPARCASPFIAEAPIILADEVAS